LRSGWANRYDGPAPVTTKKMNVPSTNDNNLLDVILDSWGRNNHILVNLLRALPEGGLGARIMPGSPSVAEMFTHIHLCG
jgi:hypothetical protein